MEMTQEITSILKAFEVTPTPFNLSANLVWEEIEERTCGNDKATEDFERRQIYRFIATGEDKNVIEIFYEYNYRVPAWDEGRTELFTHILEIKLNDKSLYKVKYCENLGDKFVPKELYTARKIIAFIKPKSKALFSLAVLD